MNENQPTRLVIVEDNPIVRENLRILLDGEITFNVVGAFSNAEDLLKNLDALKPEMLLSDLGLPGMPGIDLIREVKNRIPEIDIMAHTINEERSSVFAALKAGATGYIIKGATPRELVEALFTLRQGGAPMSPKIARAVVREFQETTHDNDFLLSAKEKDVLQGIQEGLSYKEIGTKLNISPHTVHSHIKKIYEKLQAKDKQDALIKARKRGLI